MDIPRFPSLSESSGFPTKLQNSWFRRFHERRFHLFQRVVGFRHFAYGIIVATDWYGFPSLSESSGFPTDTQRMTKLAEVKCFHLFQRVVGFRLEVTVKVNGKEKKVSISFRE